MIVSGRNATRAALQCAADNTRLFRATYAIAHGRFALEHLTACLADGGDRLPDILIADSEMTGLRVTQFVRGIRQMTPLRRMFVAVLAPHAPPADLDAFESAGADFVIRGGEPLSHPSRLFRSLVYRQIAKTDPPEFAALNLSCGTLGGCGLDVPMIL